MINTATLGCPLFSKGGLEGGGIHLKSTLGTDNLRPPCSPPFSKGGRAEGTPVQIFHTFPLPDRGEGENMQGCVLQLLL